MSVKDSPWRSVETTRRECPPSLRSAGNRRPQKMRAALGGARTGLPALIAFGSGTTPDGVTADSRLALDRERIGIIPPHCASHRRRPPGCGPRGKAHRRLTACTRAKAGAYQKLTVSHTPCASSTGVKVRTSGRSLIKAGGTRSRPRAGALRQASAHRTRPGMVSPPKVAAS